MTQARFEVGDMVRTRLGNPAGHTRLPAYLRGRRGTIVFVAGIFPLADERARGIHDAAVHYVYTVRFGAADVWGTDAQDSFTIAADLWETYLEPIQ
jgi:hypothetical protein